MAYQKSRVAARRAAARKREQPAEPADGGVIVASADDDAVTSTMVQGIRPKVTQYQFIDWSGQRVTVYAPDLEDVLDRIYNTEARTRIRARAEEAEASRLHGTVTFVYPKEPDFDKIDAAQRELIRDRARDALAGDVIE